MNHIVRCIIDFLVILVNFSYRMSIVGGLVDVVPIPYTDLRLLVLLLLVHIFRFGFKFGFISRISRYSLLFLWFLFFLFEVFQGLILMKSSSFVFLVDIFYYYVFLSYLYNLFLEQQINSYSYITTPFKAYCLYNMIVVFLCATLIALGILAADSNDISSQFNIFSSNLLTEGARYCFPGYLSVCDPNQYRALVFWGVPILDGLAHEPHVLCYTILPAFFLLLNSKFAIRHKIILYFLAFSTVIIATNATAFFALQPYY